MISLTLKHFSNKFNIRNKFQKVQKWNCHDLCFHLTFKQRRLRSQFITWDKWPLSYRNYWHLLVGLGKYMLSVLTASVNCRCCMFLPCPQKSLRDSGDHTKSTQPAGIMYAVEDVSCSLTLNASDGEFRRINSQNLSSKLRARHSLLRELNFATVS